jgi:hypothetical protein
MTWILTHKNQDCICANENLEHTLWEYKQPKVSKRARQSYLIARACAAPRFRLMPSTSGPWRRIGMLVMETHGNPLFLDSSHCKWFSSSAMFSCKRARTLRQDHGTWYTRLPSYL